MSFVDLAPAAARLLSIFKWKRVGAISESIDRDTTTLQKILKIASSKYSVKTTTREQMFLLNSGGDPKVALDALAAAKTKVFVLQAGPLVARKVFCAAYQQGMMTNDTQWVITSWYGRHWWRVPDAVVPCSVAEMDEAVRGYLGYELRGQGEDRSTIPTGEVPSEWFKRYDKHRGRWLAQVEVCVPGGVGSH